MADTKKKSDTKLVEHARRELNMCGAFEKSENYNGEMGRGILAMVKIFSTWFGDNSTAAESAADGFMRLLKGEILSPPTTNPEEWEAVEGADAGTVRSKRNPFFVSTDNGKTWMHLQTKERGNSRDHITGKDIEDDKISTDKTSDSNANSVDTEQTIEPEQAIAPADSGSSTTEGSELDNGVATQSPEDQDEAEKSTPASKNRKA